MSTILQASHEQSRPQERVATYITIFYKTYISTTTTGTTPFERVTRKQENYKFW